MFTLGSDTYVEEQGPKIKALREALGLTQAQVTQRLGVPRAPNWVLRAEKRDGDPHVNQLTHDDAKETLARGLGLSLADFKAYLAGRVTLREAVKRSSTSAVAAPEAPRSTPAPTQPEAPPQAESGAVSLEEALGLAFDPRKHTITDLRAVQDALNESYRWKRPEAEFVAAAGTWLDVAASLRRLGQRVDAVAILDRVTFGTSERSRQIALDRETIATAEGDPAGNKHGLRPLNAPATDRPIPGTEDLPSQVANPDAGSGVYGREESARLIDHAKRAAKENRAK